MAQSGYNATSTKVYVMKEIRCKNCHKLLAKAEVATMQIKCPKCACENFVNINRNGNGRLWCEGCDYKEIVSIETPELEEVIA